MFCFCCLCVRLLSFIPSCPLVLVIDSSCLIPFASSVIISVPEGRLSLTRNNACAPRDETTRSLVPYKEPFIEKKLPVRRGIYGSRGNSAACEAVTHPVFPVKRRLFITSKRAKLRLQTCQDSVSQSLFRKKQKGGEQPVLRIARDSASNESYAQRWCVVCVQT